MFLGRENELRKLNDFYVSKKFEMIVVYGRRRVGKTRLLSEFTKDKDAIFYVAEENNDILNRNKFTRSILNHFNLPETMNFDYWEDVFKFIISQKKDGRLIIVIDELPYLVNANPGFLSMLQNLIDHEYINENIMLILCGSAISFMENELVSHKSPLYGRKTGQMKIQPMDYYDAKDFFPSYTSEEQFKTYAILGGIPHYMIQFDPTEKLDVNIISKCLNTTTVFYDEPRNLLHQELRTPVVYYAIIEAIAKGASKLNEIATKINETTSKTNKYIQSLLELEIVSKIQPIGSRNSKKSIYQITDPLYIFMFKYVYQYRSLIEQDLGSMIWESKIKEKVYTLYGKMFEKVCLQYLIRKNKNLELEFLVESFGAWWGTDSQTRRQEEIDIVGLSDEYGLYCECKYRNEKVDMEVYETLVSRSKLINRETKFYYIFSKSGFTASLISLAKSDKKIKLVTLKDILPDCIMKLN